jgi:hypothetical protein
MLQNELNRPFDVLGSLPQAKNRAISWRKPLRAPQPYR